MSEPWPCYCNHCFNVAMDLVDARFKAEREQRAETAAWTERQRGRRASTWSVCWACGENVNHATGHDCEASDD